MASKRGYNFDQFLLHTKANYNAHKQFGFIIYFRLALVFSICEMDMTLLGLHPPIYLTWLSQGTTKFRFFKNSEKNTLGLKRQLKLRLTPKLGHIEPAPTNTP
jgi:hypothetical protein